MAPSVFWRVGAVNAPEKKASISTWFLGYRMWMKVCCVSDFIEVGGVNPPCQPARNEPDGFNLVHFGPVGKGDQTKSDKYRFNPPTRIHPTNLNLQETRCKGPGMYLGQGRPESKGVETGVGKGGQTDLSHTVETCTGCTSGPLGAGRKKVGAQILQQGEIA